MMEGGGGEWEDGGGMGGWGGDGRESVVALAII